MNINRVVGVQNKNRFKHFTSFLKVLEVYGTGYLDDIDSKRYRLREKQSHRGVAIKALQDIVTIFKIVLYQLNADNLDISQSRYSKLGSSVMKDQFLLLFKFQKSVFEELLNI